MQVPQLCVRIDDHFFTWSVRPIGRTNPLPRELPLLDMGQRFHAVMELRVTSSSHVLSILPQSKALKWECVHRMWYDGIRNHHSPDLMVLPGRLDLLYRESHCLLDTPNPRTLDQPTSSTNLTFLIGFVWFQLLPHALCES